MGAMVSQITSLAIVYSTLYPGADQRKHRNSASLAGELPAQMASNAENVSIWWHHHEMGIPLYMLEHLVILKSDYQSFLFILWLVI